GTLPLGQQAEAEVCHVGDYIGERAEARHIFEKLSEKDKSRVLAGRRLLLGEEARVGWKGKLPFYLFCCPVCETVSKDYPHSFPERQYLGCQNPNCDGRVSCVTFATKLRMARDTAVVILKCPFLPFFPTKKPPSY
ncbi:MAG: hypothetical protein Q7S36_00525, partial [Candidatus Liptonbacteria bacterium]|nr:hypothetical protein [Candidatus Liptonbacteria bacterium]